MNYPEYINGVKQEQNVLKRLGIRIWYSTLFRILFVILGFIWIIPSCFALLYFFPNLIGDIRQIGGFIYLSVYYLASKYNDFSNLRRIGRDEKGNLLYYVEETIYEEEYEEEDFVLCLSLE